MNEVDNICIICNCGKKHYLAYYLTLEEQKKKQQLQSYKQKEDKLREYCNESIVEQDTINDPYTDARFDIANDLLEILNEGDK